MTSTQAELDLEDLEAETNAILERFGKSRLGTRSKLPSSLLNHRSPKRRDGARPLTQMGAFNRSCRLGSAAYDGSKKKMPYTDSAALKGPYAQTMTRAATKEETRPFKADQSASKKLQDTISSALSGTKFDSVPSLLAESRPKSSRPKSLAIRDVEYPGLISAESKPHSVDLEKEVCFNCWSAGVGMECTITKDSDSVSMMCSNWDASYLRRKYRSEEIQEVFSALVYDKSKQRFSTHEEAQHPIYRLIDNHLRRLNLLYQRRQKTKIWLKSFISKLKEGSFQNNRSARSAKTLCLRGTERNMSQVQQLTSEIFDKLPKAPITGTTLKEKLGQEQVLVEKIVNVDGIEKVSEFIITGPTPVPQALYRPRKYRAPNPVKFIMPTTAGADSNNDELCGLDFSLLLRDPNNSIDYATFGRKGSNNNVAVGGLSAQMLVSKLFTKCFAPQYSGITCKYEAIILPPNQTFPNVPTLQVPPDDLPCVCDDLVTPLDNRRSPTIMTKVGISPDDRHYFGLNRIEQTGEEEDFGFRTSTSYTLPEPNSRIDTNTFEPSESIATANDLAITPFRTMRADETYPFCQENSRSNRVEDLYHLLLSNDDCSSNKLQVFTTVASQNVGYYMLNGDASLPIGRMNTKVIRTWAFLQSEPEKGVGSDDDAPHQRMYKEEKDTLGLGGVVFNDRPRYQDMPKGVLSSNRRSDVRNAILRRSMQDESKLNEGAAEDASDRPVLEGLLDTILSKRVGKKHAEYLPFVMNLPSAQCVGTLKPKKSTEEWAEKDYNPWVEGKKILSTHFVWPTHFVWSLTQETKWWPRANHNKEDPVQSNTDKEFAALCSLVRHGKYHDLEDTLNNPELALPIDHVDNSGNTLLMIACQNGNRRVAKLCLRRGSEINKQNLNGNTCLHFAFGYGFAALGDYLISKGADDSITNVNSLTCYEGLDIEL